MTLFLFGLAPPLHGELAGQVPDPGDRVRLWTRGSVVPPGASARVLPGTGDTLRFLLQESGREVALEAAELERLEVERPFLSPKRLMGRTAIGAGTGGAIAYGTVALIQYAARDWCPSPFGNECITDEAANRRTRNRLALWGVGLGGLIGAGSAMARPALRWEPVALPLALGLLPATSGGGLRAGMQISVPINGAARDGRPE